MKIPRLAPTDAKFSKPAELISELEDAGGAITASETYIGVAFLIVNTETKIETNTRKITIGKLFKTMATKVCISISPPFSSPEYNLSPYILKFRYVILKGT